MQYKHAIIAGKFLPVHNGHVRLIQTAAEQSEKVTVLVVDNPAYPIPAYIRENWIRATFAFQPFNVMVHAIPDLIGNDDSQSWATHVLRFLHGVPDVVYSSDEYARAFAGYLKCDFVHVERNMAARVIRQDILAHLSDLPAVVRAHFVKRVAIIGAESTGKTTLASTLAKHYQTNWVPEYARTYCDGKLFSDYSTWRTEEFTHIAVMQLQMEDMLAQSANRVLLCDTDPFATSVWHFRYMGTEAPQVLQLASIRHYDTYLLTDDAIPFVQDGTRDGEHIRHQMHQWFIERLNASRRPYTIICGDLDTRVKQGIRVIDQLLATNPMPTNSLL